MTASTPDRAAPHASDTPETEPPKKTPLHALHLELGGKMVPFAGYDMPVQYRLGIMKEHLHTREKAGLFDVSHMGQYLLSVPESVEPGVKALFEELVPGNITGLKPGRMRYTQLTTEDGGIIDDLMATYVGPMDGRDWLFLVLNAGCKHGDAAHIRAKLDGRAELKELPDQALLALQGPGAVACLAKLLPDCAEMSFMSILHLPETPYGSIWVTRSGYTGEDGFEISLEGSEAEAFARDLLAMDDVEPIGLGARDSLRLEAGLPLYGHELDLTTSPVEAGLTFSIGKARREQGGFPGDDRILRELKDGPSRKLVALKPEGRAPAREGTEITKHGQPIGVVTSGGFGPSVGGPVALGYVEARFGEIDSELDLMVRGKALPARVVALPFVPHRYFRKKTKA